MFLKEILIQQVGDKSGIGFIAFYHLRDLVNPLVPDVY